MGLLSSWCCTSELLVFLSWMSSLVLKWVQFPSDQPVQLCPTQSNLLLTLIFRIDDISTLALSFQVTTWLIFYVRGLPSCDLNLSPASRQPLYHWPSLGDRRLRSNKLQHPIGVMEDGLTLPHQTDLAGGLILSWQGSESSSDGTSLLLGQF